MMNRNNTSYITNYERTSSMPRVNLARPVYLFIELSPYAYCIVACTNNAHYTGIPTYYIHMYIHTHRSHRVILRSTISISTLTYHD